MIDISVNMAKPLDVQHFSFYLSIQIHHDMMLMIAFNTTKSLSRGTYVYRVENSKVDTYLAFFRIKFTD